MTMTAIIDVRGREILDSRGNPTVEVDVLLEDGASASAAVPSGASTGTHEAVELRDGDRTRFHGKGVLKALDAINGEIFDAVRGMEAHCQRDIDDCLVSLDGTPDKARLGANAVLGVSLAVARAAANQAGIPLWRHVGGLAARQLPVPQMNVINGGAHADNALDFQEFMILPAGCPSFREAVRAGSEIFHQLRHTLQARGHSTNVGDEGGFAPQIGDTREALDLLMSAIDGAGYRPGEDVFLALDPAASELYRNGRYVFSANGRKLESSAMIELYRDLLESYPITSIEDGLAEDDWEGWQALTRELGDRVQLVGDDIFVTRQGRLERGIETGVANAILVKVNQVGTLSEAMATVACAHERHYRTVMSHRSGETEDTTIADLAVGLGCRQIKTGSLSRSDRTAKYNRLLKIEEELDTGAVWPGQP